MDRARQPIALDRGRGARAVRPGLPRARRDASIARGRGAGGRASPRHHRGGIRRRREDGLGRQDRRGGGGWRVAPEARLPRGAHAAPSLCHSLVARAARAHHGVGARPRSVEERAVGPDGGVPLLRRLRARARSLRSRRARSPARADCRGAHRAGLVVVAIFAVGAPAAIAAAKLSGNDASITVRAATLRIGLAAVQERPWLGFGANGFPHESARIERALFGHELLELHPANQPFSAHDAYMNVAVERGVGALIAFLGLLGVIVMSGLRRSARAGDVDRDVIVVGLLAGLVAFAAQALTENLFSYSKVSTIFWILAAALVSFGGRTDEPQAR